MNPLKNSDKIENVGIAIKIENPDRHYHHVGILHKGKSSKKIGLLHQKFHHVLKNEDPDESYLWVKPNINPNRLTQVAAMCRKVWKECEKGGIPFGFSPPNKCIDEQTGKYLLGPAQRGLTCATFVLAVFEASGSKLANLETWPLGRPGDKEWQEYIIKCSERRNADPEHIAAVKGEIGIARFRPEEVAGASLELHISVDFEVAREHSEEVLKRLYDT